MTDARLAPNMPQWMRDHAERYLASGGAEGHMYAINLPNVPHREVASLLLFTIGRKSGERFIFPLFYGRVGESYIIVASKGGAPEHPGWYRNLLAHPEAEIQVGTRKLRVRARTAAGEERTRLWERALAFWPPYADYQRKVPQREIPVVVLDPID